MKHLISTLTLALALMLTASCNSKEKSIDELSNLVENMKANSNEFTEEDWSEAGEQFESICNDLAKHNSEYSAEEKREIVKLTTQAGMLLMKSKLKEAIPMIQGVADGLKESSADCQDVVDEYTKAAGEILQGITQTANDAEDDE